jgi:glycogen debranching enzyme-like protein
VKVDAAAGQTFKQALGLEWLEANGRGGFSFGTVAGAKTTRDHAVLLTARKPAPKSYMGFVFTSRSFRSTACLQR